MSDQKDKGPVEGLPAPPPPPPVSATDPKSLSAEVEVIDDAEVELISDASDVEVIDEVIDASDLEVVAEPLLDIGPPAWAPEREFYVREARALAENQPERAALMWADAAAVAERNLGEVDTIVGDLDGALTLRPDSTWLLPRARRAMMRLGAFEKAIKIGQREVKMGGDNAGRAAVLVESAAVVRYAVGEPKTALRLVEAALKVSGRSIPALATAAALHETLEQHQQGCEALERLAGCLTDPAERSLALYTAGTVREIHLGDTETAKSTYLRATEADPKNVPAIIALCELHEIAGEWQLLCRSFEHLADLLDQPEAKARLLKQAGSLHLDRTADLEAATRDLGRAVRATPDDPVAVQRLAYAYDAKGRMREVVQTLRQLLELKPDSQGRAALLSQIGGLHIDLHEIDPAIGAYRESLEQVPGYLPAVQALATLYRQRGDFDSLLAIANPETEGLLPAPARAVRYVDLAEILTDKLHRPDDAIAAYRRAIELRPRLHLAHWGLQTLLRRLDDFQSLGDALGAQAAEAADPRAKTFLLREQARLLAGPLAQPEQAIAILRAIGTVDDAQEIPLELIELCRRAERHGDLVELLLKRAETTTDADEAESRRIEAARTLEFQLDEHDRALEIYLKVLQTRPKSHLAIHNAGRLMYQRGAWNELVKLHHHELVNEPDRADAATLLYRVGRILAEHLGHRSAAINAFAKALRQDPSCTPALSALDGLVRTERRWEDLVKVLTRFAETSTDDAEAARALCRAGEITGWQLDALDEAAALFDQALQRDGNAHDAMHLLLRIRLRQRRFDDAVTLLEQVKDLTEGQARSALLWQLARMREFRLKLTPDVALYEEAAAKLESHLGSELLRVERLASQSTSPDALARRLEELAMQTADDALAAAYLLDAAHAREFTTTTETADSSIAEAFRRRPDDLPTLWAYERNLRRRGDWAGLAELYDREAQMELDRSVRVQHLAATADAHFRAGNIEVAERICRECLNFDAHCLPALRLLVQVAEQAERWSQVAELHDRLAEACHDPDNRRDSCLLAAELWLERLDEPSRALASLSVLLADDPGQVEAFARAETLMRARGEFSELSGLYQRRIRSCKEDAERVVLLRDHARLMRENLGQPDRAIHDLNALLELLPDDVQTLSELADLHGQENHWSDAASALGLLVDRAQDADVRHDGRLRLATLWLRRLHEPRRARVVLEAAAAERPDDLEVHKLQVRLATTVGDWSDAKALLDRVAKGADAPTQIWAKLQQAEVARLGMRDLAQADAYTAEAITIAAHSESALDALRDHFEGKEDRRRLCEICERQLGDASGDAQLALREMVSRIYLEDLDLPAQALPHLETLVTEVPERKELALLLARALERAGQAPQAADRYRALLLADASTVEAYRGLVSSAEPQVVTAAASLVELLGPVDEKEARLLRALEQPVAPRSAFSAAQLAPMTRDPSVDELLNVLLPYLPELLELDDGGEPLASTEPAASEALSLARTLGIAALTIRRERGDVASFAVGDPLTLRLGASLIEQAGKPAFLFWTARTLARSLGGGLLLHSLEEKQLEALLSAIFDKKPEGSAAQQLKKALARQLPRKVRKQVEQLHRPDASSWRTYRAALATLADRLALVLCRNPGAALAALARSREIGVERIGDDDALAELMRFAVSTDFASLHRTIWD